MISEMQKVETISKTLASKRPLESRPSVKPRQYNLCDYDGLKSLNSLGSLLEVLHQGNERIAILLVASNSLGGHRSFEATCKVPTSKLRPWFDLKATQDKILRFSFIGLLRFWDTDLNPAKTECRQF